MIVEFDHKSPNYSKDPEVNELFLRVSQNYLVDMLRMREHLFLNEVLDQLGLPRKSEGQLVGWLYAIGKDICLWEEIWREDNVGIRLVFTHEGEIYKDIER